MSPCLNYFVIFLCLGYVQLAYSQDTTRTAVDVPVDSLVVTDSTTVAVPDSMVPPVKEQIDYGVPFQRGWNLDVAEAQKLIIEDYLDFLQLDPNIQALDYGSLGQFAPLSYRGSSALQNNMLFGNYVMEDPIYGYLSTTNLPINLTDSFYFTGLDIVQTGGYSGISGTSGFSPVRYRDKRPYSKVTYRAGDWGYSDIGVTFGIPLARKFQVAVNGSRQELDGFEPNRNHKGNRLLTEFVYLPSPNSEISLNSFYNKHTTQIPAPLLPDFVPWKSLLERRETRWDHALSTRIGQLYNTGREFRATLLFNRIHMESKDDSVRFDNRNLTYGLVVRQAWLLNRQKLELGGEFRKFDLSSPQLGDHSDSFGFLYAGMMLRLGTRWQFGLQARLEKRQNYNFALHPVSTIRFLLSEHTMLWIGLHRSARYPGFAERYWPTAFYKGNPDLKNEYGTMTETGFSINPDGNIRLRASIFAHKTTDWIGYGPTDDELAYGPLNRGERTIAGSSLDFKWAVHSQTEFGIIGSYLNVQEDQLDKQLFVPEYTFFSYAETGKAFFSDYINVRLRAIARGYGKRYGYFYANPQVAFPDIIVLPVDAVFDFRASFLFSGPKIWVAWENIFNRSYQLVPGFSMPPVTFRFGIEWAFWD